MQEFYASHNLSALTTWLLLINGIDVTILWAGLTKPSKEFSCSQNLVAARELYDARQTFYTSGYENLVEKSARHTSGFCFMFGFVC